jgi:hypothetical protein
MPRVTVLADCQQLATALLCSALLQVSQFSVGDSHGKFVVEEELEVGL